MPTYTWQFPALDVFPNYQGLTDAVFAVHWRLTGDDGNGHAATAYGSQPIGQVDIANFTPFASLTFDKVRRWVEAAMDAGELADCKDDLDQRIAEQIVPVVETLPSPWA